MAEPTKTPAVHPKGVPVPGFGQFPQEAPRDEHGRSTASGPPQTADEALAVDKLASK